MQQPLRNVLLMTTGGILTATLLVGVGVWRTSEGILEKLGGIFYPTQPTPQVDVRSLIVQQIRSASELTTAVLTVEAVVPTRQDRVVAGYVVGTTKLLYIAYGEVRAGVDLNELKPTDIKVVNNIVQINLPPAKILDSKIDVNRSSVYDYDRGLLGLGPDVAPQLQTEAQQEALKKMETAACKAQLLQQADNRAKLAIAQLLNLSGYKQVEIHSTVSNSSSCP